MADIAIDADFIQRLLDAAEALDRYGRTNKEVAYAQGAYDVLRLLVTNPTGEEPVNPNSSYLAALLDFLPKKT